jgi:hypothetical protein
MSRYMHARTWLFVLVPITLIFAGSTVWAIVVFVTGVVRADGEKIIGGGLGTGASLFLLMIVGPQLRSAWGDARTVRIQRRKT